LTVNIRPGWKRLSDKRSSLLHYSIKYDRTKILTLRPSDNVIKNIFVTDNEAK